MDWEDDDSQPELSLDGQTSNENLEGFQIDGSFENEADTSDEDLKSLWETLEDEAAGIVSDARKATPTGYGGGTAADLQTFRFSNMEAKVQQAAKDISGNTVPSWLGLDGLDIRVAQEEFGKTIEGDPAVWAHSLNTEGKLGGDVTTIDPLTGKAKYTSKSGPSRGDYVTALSMMGVTANEYLEKGPGQNLVGNTKIAERIEDADEKLLLANNYAAEIADLYISSGTKGTDIEGDRHEAVQTSITKRMLMSVGGPVLPLPNEIKEAKGLVRTQTHGGRGQGTAMTRLSHSAEFSEHLIKNAAGFDELSIAAPEGVVKAFWATKPSLKDSLFPLPKGTKDKPLTMGELESNKLEQGLKYAALQEKAAFVRATYRAELPEHSDESKGQISHAGFHTPYGEQADSMNLRNEAAILDLEYSAGEDERTDRAIDANTIDSAGKQVARDVASGQTLQGSSTGGMYGDKAVTEAQDFVTEGKTINELIAEEEDIPRVESDLTRYQDLVASEQAAGRFAEQGTQAWKDERKGNISASWLPNATKKHRVDDLAMAHFRSVEGIETFRGNSDTQEGNDSEDKVRFAMMAHLNRGKPKEERMDFQEAFFRSRDDLAIGASADGAMFNPDGSSSGGVELKYLSSGSIKGAKKKYYEQMQFQMLVSGEDQTHFGVLNKDDNQFHYELIKADSETQERLLEESKAALAMSGGLTSKEIQTMENKRKRKKKSNDTKPVEDVTGQEDSFKEEEEEVEAPMEGFKARPPKKVTGTGARYETRMRKAVKEAEAAEAELDRVEDLTFIADAERAYSKVPASSKVVGAAQAKFAPITSSIGSASQTMFAQQMIKDEAKQVASEVKAAVEDTKEVAPTITAETPKPKVHPGSIWDGSARNSIFAEQMIKDEAKSQKKRLESIVSDNIAPVEGDGGSGDGGSGDAKARIDELGKAASSSARDIRDFGKTTLSVASELVNLVKKGTDSVLDEDRASRMAGMTAAEGRGVRERLQEANLTTKDTASLLSAAGKQTQALAEDPTSVTGLITRMATAYSTGSEELQGMDLPDAGKLITMGGKERLSEAMDAINAVSSPMDKMKVARAWGFPELATANDVTGKDIFTAEDEVISGMLPAARKTDTGLEAARQTVQEVAEKTSQVGEGIGEGAGITGAVAAVGGSVTAGVIGKSALSKFASSNPAATVRTANATREIKATAKKAGASTLKAAAKVGSVVSKVSPVALATAAVPMAIRYGADVEDDGSFSDSVLDVLEFGGTGAALGAAAGSVIPGVGTAIGGAVGGAIGTVAGLANEAYEYFDAQPSTKIKEDEFAISKGSDGKPVVNNIEVINTINKDGTTTEVRENGEEIYMEEDSSQGFGR